MANNLSSSFPEIWAREQQEVFHKENVAMKIANYQTGLAGKKFGDTLNRVYRTMSEYVDVYVPGTDATEEDLTNGKEALIINKRFSKRFYIDDQDDIQSQYSEALKYGEDTGKYLSNQVDADVLGEALNAGSSSTVGTLATDNILSTLTGVNKAMAKKNVMGKDKYGVISPEFEEILIQYVSGKETVKADQVGMNGYLLSRMGFDFYVSNQLTSTAVLALATQPTANDTVTIAGQVFKFVAVPANAGEIDLGSDVDATRANLATLINAPGTTTAGGIALTGEALKMFKVRVSAVNDDSANTLTVTGKGLGVLDVSSSLTTGTNIWTAASQLQHNLFGVKGNPYLIMQKAPKVNEKENPNRDGKNYINTILYGVKTFADNSPAMVDVIIRCDAYTA